MNGAGSSTGEQRRRVARLLRESPSLGPKLEECIQDAYPTAVTFASVKTGILEEDFPGDCPYRVEQILGSMASKGRGCEPRILTPGVTPSPHHTGTFMRRLTPLSEAEHLVEVVFLSLEARFATLGRRGSHRIRADQVSRDR